MIGVIIGIFFVIVLVVGVGVWYTVSRSKANSRHGATTGTSDAFGHSGFENPLYGYDCFKITTPPHPDLPARCCPPHVFVVRV